MWSFSWEFRKLNSGDRLCTVWRSCNEGRDLSSQAHYVLIEVRRVSLKMTKREKPLGVVGQQWKLLDIVIFAMMSAILILFTLIFTSLGDSLALAGQRELDAATKADPTSSGKF